MTNNQYVDADSYQGGGKDLTFEFIVLEHLRRITRIASQEWHGGKMVHKTQFGHQSQRFDENAFYIESKSEAYSHAVECLMDLLLPQADSQLLECEEKNDAIVDESLEALNTFGRTGFFTKEELEQAKNQRGDDLRIKAPPERIFEDAKEIIYRKIAKQRRRLFREIVLFLNRIDFFNAGGNYEEEIIE